MKTPLLILLVLLGGTIVPPIASAGTITSDGGTFGYTAAPGEANFVLLEQTTTCETLAAPCLHFTDLAYNPVTVPAACVDTGFNGVLCPLPRSAGIDLGDRVDLFSDWDGPSVIHAGPGEDVVRAQGGNDVLYGDDGNDQLKGGGGVDRLYGGEGHDILVGESSADKMYGEVGNDTLVGGNGSDLLNGGDGLDFNYGGNDDDYFYSRDLTFDFLAGDAGNDSAESEDEDVRETIENLIT